MSTPGEAYGIHSGDIYVCQCGPDSRGRFFRSLKIIRGGKEVLCFCGWKSVCANIFKAVLVLVQLTEKHQRP